MRRKRLITPSIPRKPQARSSSRSLRARELHRKSRGFPTRFVTATWTAALFLALFASCRRAENVAQKTIDASSGAVPSSSANAAACGAFECRTFGEPIEAFEHVLATGPRVLAVGEAHAQRGTEGIASSTKRFTDDFLPTLKGRASALVLELWLGEPKCGKVVETVRDQQKPVTSSQVKTNPNEIVALGDRAYALGIRPFPLRPSCEDYAPIADAGADGVPRMLELIARLSRERLESLLASDAGSGLVLAYGGALHNDVAPGAGKEKFSFGAALTKSTNGKYVELDLIVGDYVRNEAPWTSLPWVATYLAMPKTTKTLLIKTAPNAYVLVFPKRE